MHLLRAKEEDIQISYLSWSCREMNSKERPDRIHRDIFSLPLFSPSLPLPPSPPSHQEKFLILLI
jgi:hypothetical protein